MTYEEKYYPPLEREVIDSEYKLKDFFLFGGEGVFGPWLMNKFVLHDIFLMDFVFLTS